MELIKGGFFIVAKLLHSKIAEAVRANHVVDNQTVELIMPQLDKIQNAVHELKLKDHRVALDKYIDALQALRQKFNNFFTYSEINFKRHSKEIKVALAEAQKSALEAANHSGLKTQEYLDSYKWILATELLGVLNEMTFKHWSKINANDLAWLQTKLSQARAKCSRYLEKLNENREIADFIASKITVEGYKKKSKLQFNRKDRTEQVIECLQLNADVAKFFHVMKRNCGTANALTAEPDLQPEAGALKIFESVGCTAEVKEPRLMAMSPMTIAMMLFEKTGKKGYADVEGEFQILKQVQEPFFNYVQTENTEIIPKVLSQLSTMRSEIRSEAMSIMQQTKSSSKQ